MIGSATAAFIFHLLSALAGLWLLYVIYKGWAVRSWPAVPGTVLESHVEVDADRNDFPVVRYQYSVNGIDYRGDRVLPHGRLASTGGYAARVVARYRQGRAVQVYFNPARPGESALETRIPLAIYLMLFVAVPVFWWMGNLFRGGFAE